MESNYRVTASTNEIGRRIGLKDAKNSRECCVQFPQRITIQILWWKCKWYKRCRYKCRHLSWSWSRSTQTYSHQYMDAKCHRFNGRTLCDICGKSGTFYIALIFLWQNLWRLSVVQIQKAFIRFWKWIYVLCRLQWHTTPTLAQKSPFNLSITHKSVM